jgi:hypothetical protein
MVAAGAEEDKLAPYCFKADEDYYISGTCKIESEHLASISSEARSRVEEAAGRIAST